MALTPTIMVLINGIDGMPSIEDEQRRVISRKVPIRIRYQQFTEFSSYTFELPYFETRDPLSTKECFEQGEGLIQALKGLDGWWDDIPGELFLVAIVASTPAESKGNKKLLQRPQNRRAIRS